MGSSTWRVPKGVIESGSGAEQGWCLNSQSKRGYKMFEKLSGIYLFSRCKWTGNTV